MRNVHIAFMIFTLENELINNRDLLITLIQSISAINQLISTINNNSSNSIARSHHA